MDIIKYINDKKYFNCDYKKIEPDVKENVEKELKEIKRNSFIRIKKTKFAVFSLLYTLAVVLIVSTIFVLSNHKFGHNAEMYYNNKRIEYYEYFDTFVASGPKERWVGEIEMLYKLDFLSEEDKTILKEYEEEVIAKKYADCVAFSIGLGIKNGKDQIYLVCYPAKNLSANFYPELYYGEKKTFIFDSNCNFKFEKVLEICKGFMIKKGVEEKKAEEILKEYDGDYLNYKGIRIEIFYSNSVKFTNDPEKNKEIKRNANVIYMFNFGFYQKDYEYGLRKVNQISIFEDELIN